MCEVGIRKRRRGAQELTLGSGYRNSRWGSARQTLGFSHLLLLFLTAILLVLCCRLDERHDDGVVPDVVGQRKQALEVLVQKRNPFVGHFPDITPPQVDLARKVGEGAVLRVHGSCLNDKPLLQVRLHVGELVEGPADDVFGTILACYSYDVHLTPKNKGRRQLNES